MKTIKAKINLFIFVTLGASVFFSFRAYDLHRKQETVQRQIAKSLLMRDHVQGLKLKKRTPKVKKRLKSFKKNMVQENRQMALSNVIQAYNSTNPRLLSRRVKQFQKEEKEFFKVASWTLAKYKKEGQFYILLGVLVPIFSILGLAYYFNFGVLSPLQGLSNRMMEFLLDQYTFRFSSPANNEIGNLERTFNSLAQKVMNNLDELHALDRAKSEFVSIASHELRTPLTSIKGSLGLLSNDIVGCLDTDAKELIQVAEQETDRLVRLINEMLDLAKIESRSLTLSKEWLPLETVFERTIQGIQGFARASQVNLEIAYGPQPITVHIDCDRIQQILTNLISNAIKYSPVNGTVTLKATIENNGAVEVSVNDQGPGISEENQGLIFQKFRQATDSSNHLVKGTGLGLAISKALIEEHDGQIGVRSNLGEGSSFYFTLPEWKNTQSDETSNPKAA